MSHLGRAQRHQFSLNTQGKKYSSFICDYLFLKQVTQSRGLEDRPAELYCRLQVAPTRMDPSSCDHGASALGWTQQCCARYQQPFAREWSACITSSTILQYFGIYASRYLVF